LQSFAIKAHKGRNKTSRERATRKRAAFLVYTETQRARANKGQTSKAKQEAKRAFYPLQVDIARTQKNNNPQSPIKAA
jgi:hypothetical protein